MFPCDMGHVRPVWCGKPEVRPAAKPTGQVDARAEVNRTLRIARPFLAQILVQISITCLIPRQVVQCNGMSRGPRHRTEVLARGWVTQGNGNEWVRPARTSPGKEETSMAEVEKQASISPSGFFGRTTRRRTARSFFRGKMPRNRLLSRLHTPRPNPRPPRPRAPTCRSTPMGRLRLVSARRTRPCARLFFRGRDRQRFSPLTGSRRGLDVARDERKREAPRGAGHLDAPLPDLGCERRSEPMPPETNRLVAHVDAAFVQQILDVSE